MSQLSTGERILFDRFKDLNPRGFRGHDGASLFGTHLPPARSAFDEARLVATALNLGRSIEIAYRDPKTRARSIETVKVFSPSTQTLIDLFRKMLESSKAAALSEMGRTFLEAQGTVSEAIQSKIDVGVMLDKIHGLLFGDDRELRQAILAVINDAIDRDPGDEWIMGAAPESLLILMEGIVEMVPFASLSARFAGIVGKLKRGSRSMTGR